MFNNLNICQGKNCSRRINLDTTCEKIISYQNNFYVVNDLDMSTMIPLFCKECYSDFLKTNMNSNSNDTTEQTILKYMSRCSYVACNCIAQLRLMLMNDNTGTSIDKFYKKHPELYNKYFVHIIKNKEITVKYFDDIDEAYLFMRHVFFKYINKNSGIDENLLTTNHENIFGRIKREENSTNNTYHLIQQLSKQQVKELYTCGYLKSDLIIVNPTHKKTDDEYFQLRLVDVSANNYSIDNDTCVFCTNEKIVNDKYCNYCSVHDPLM